MECSKSAEPRKYLFPLHGAAGQPQQKPTSMQSTDSNLSDPQPVTPNNDHKENIKAFSEKSEDKHQAS